MFAQCSGQKVNKEKTRIFFSNNVHDVVRQQISDGFGFQRAADLGRYLGVPVGQQGTRSSTYNYVLDRAKQRMSNWKCNQLSFAGRLTLTKSVLQALPSYVMQTTPLPVALCDSLDQVSRSFVWGDSATGRKIHWKRWEGLCTPKDAGGLGLRQSRLMNQSFMMKAAWKLCKEKDSLWARVVRSKYGCGGDLLPRIDQRKPGSRFWKGICEGWSLVEPNLCWRIRNGGSVNFWNHNWIPGVGKLSAQAWAQGWEVCPLQSMKDFVNEHGDWDYNKLQTWVPTVVRDIILGLKPPDEMLGADSVA